MVVLRGWAFSYERGIPVPTPGASLVLYEWAGSKKGRRPPGGAWVAKVDGFQKSTAIRVRPPPPMENLEWRPPLVHEVKGSGVPLS